MLPLETLTVFFGFALALAAVPGPDNIFVLAQSAMNGKRAGLIVTLGLASGLVVHTTAAALGVAVLFQTSELAFSALKYAGAAYLVFLAYQALTADAAKLDGAPPQTSRPSRMYIRGLIMNIANPKVTIFILAFLPQFIDPDLGSTLGQFYTLGLLLILATVVVFGSIALAAGALSDILREKPSVQKGLNRVSGLIFLGLAIKLATSQQ